MKRYSMTSIRAYSPAEDPNGAWVRYEDAQAEIEALKKNARWVSVTDRLPDKTEPVVYARPDQRRGKGHYHVGIAYWTVSEKWNPEAESVYCQTGFTHWMPLPNPPIDEAMGDDSG